MGSIIKLTMGGVCGGLATMDIYEREGLFKRAGEIESKWEECARQLDLASQLDARAGTLMRNRHGDFAHRRGP